MYQKKTSIIILTYNKLEYTQACIESIRKYTPRGAYQLIVVDNLSTDGTREWLVEQTDILTIYNDENVGFPKGCNQGIELATDDSILLLNNDILATENWLGLMNDCLYSSDDIGAVGPVTNSAYGDQEIAATYSSLDEMWSFANAYNLTSKQDWEQRLKLIGFCMLIKKEVIAKVGLLDEIFSPGMCEDSDYSFRIIEGGYKLILCRNVFIHHYGSTSFGEMPERRQQLWNHNRGIFLEKWGFHTAYHTQSREDLVQLIDESDRQKAIRVLDVGCACGANLLKVKYAYANAELYGIERNVNAAAIARTIATVTTENAENVALDTDFYDFIILGDILQLMVNPWEFLSRIRNALKDNGKVIASIPNASHYSVLFSLLKEKSLYGENEILGRDQLRLFTLPEIQKLFEDAGLEQVECIPIQNEVSNAEQQFINQLALISGSNHGNHFNVLKYVIAFNKANVGLTTLGNLLEQVGKTNGQADVVLEIINVLRDHTLDSSIIIQAMISLDIDKQLVYNILANRFFEHGLYNDIVPLLNASLEINPKHHDTLFNYASILHSIGADEAALQYLNLIQEKDVEFFGLLEEINKCLKDNQ